MDVEEVDPISGRKTTGHEWNGIKELDTPVPRGVLLFLVITHVFALIWWVLLPTWPLGTTYTKGLLESTSGTSSKRSLPPRLQPGRFGRRGLIRSPTSR